MVLSRYCHETKVLTLNYRARHCVPKSICRAPGLIKRLSEWAACPLLEFDQSTSAGYIMAKLRRSRPR
jgi:hypothetical protein